ncbi:MAG: hypothetical protein M3007_04395 [Candidatus Eremiobacteraeota bacterium]|nr:hypothetical protein [Candidatus Eremiobacteraeota bacterium]
MGTKRAGGKRAAGAAKHNGAPSVTPGRKPTRDRGVERVREPEIEEAVITIDEYDEGEDFDENYDDEDEELHPENSEEEY